MESVSLIPNILKSDKKSKSIAINAVIDISHHNINVDFVSAKTDGIVGVIHKASQGLTYTDPTYVINKTKALNAGLYWGAYHFGTCADGVKQADYFLDITQAGPQDLLVLDFEPNTTGATMTLEQARAFVSRVFEKTGRWPGLYSGQLIKELLGTKKDKVLVNCWLWISHYAKAPVIPPNWRTWTMWQYTDGSVGPEPHSVKGIGNCDREKFNGSLEGLQRLWNIPIV